MSKFIHKWYAFSRLLEIPIEESFLCTICGPSLETVVCDGTMVGFRKDLLPALQTTVDEIPREHIRGSAHSERTLVRTKRAREFLLKYSGYSKDRKRLARPQSLTLKEFSQLCKGLRTDGFVALAQLLERLENESDQ